MNPMLDKLGKTNIQFLKWPIALNTEDVMQRPACWTILHFWPADLQLRRAAWACGGDFARLSARFREGHLMRTGSVRLP
jgi:hypothetical protein